MRSNMARVTHYKGNVTVATKVVICFDLVVYPEQGYNSTTVHFVSLVLSPGTVDLCTFVPRLHFPKHAQDILFSRSYFTD